MCLIYLQVDMLCCFKGTDMYAGTSYSNTKYNMKYNFMALAVWDTIYRFAKVNHDLTTQQSIIITGLLIQILHAIYRNISNMTDESRPVNPRMHYVVLKVTSTGCLKLYLNLWELQWKCSMCWVAYCHVIKHVKITWDCDLSYCVWQIES